MLRTSLEMLRHVFNAYSSRSLDLEGLFGLGPAVHIRKCLTKKVCFDNVKIFLGKINIGSDNAEN